MEEKNENRPVAQLIESAKSVIVVLPPDPSQDLVAAALSLHLSLKESGKQSQIGCGSEVHLDGRLRGAEEIADSIGSRNLVIAFDYDENDLDKVDYDVRPDGKFYLLVKPKPGSPVPEVNNVKYSYSGASADLVITFSINSLEELGKIYADEKNFLDNANILSLNISPRPASFTGNLFHQMTGSFSELVTVLLEKTKLKINPDAALNLLNSIHEETGGLTSPRMTADTFAAIAFLMRSGARLPNQQAFIPKFTPPPFFEAPQAPELSFGDPAQQEIFEEEEPQAVPVDWKKPKIFRATDS